MVGFYVIDFIVREVYFMHSAIKKGFVLSMLALSLVCSSMTAFAEEEIGPGVSGSKKSSGTVAEGSNGVPSTITGVTVPENLDLDSIVAGAGLDALGEGNTPADPILGVVPFVNYRFQNKDGVDLAVCASYDNSYAYSKDGFSKFYMIHNGIGRYYYRTYSAAEGWSIWCNSNERTNTGSTDVKVQAVQIRIKGYTANLDDIYYKAVLSDGTVLDWAKNGQTMGTMGTDAYIVALKVALWNKECEFTQPTKTLMEAPAYEGMYIDSDGVRKYSTFDGRAYTGWAYEGNEQYYFAEGNMVTGWQYIDGYKYYFNEDGTACRDLEPVMGLTGDYQIKFNKATRTLYVMAKDGDNGYIIPYKTFMAACGPDTPIGSYRIYAKYDWKFMHDNIYCQYLNRFNGGFIIHSILYYNSPSPYTLDAITYNYMDDAISGGCIRLLSGDAAWVYHNAPMGTPVITYYDPANKGPIEKTAIETPIPRDQTWDPTDPVVIQAQKAQAEAAAAAQAAAEAEAMKASLEAVEATEENPAQ